MAVTREMTISSEEDNKCLTFVGINESVDVDTWFFCPLPSNVADLRPGEGISSVPDEFSEL